MLMCADVYAARLHLGTSGPVRSTYSSPRLLRHHVIRRPAVPAGKDTPHFFKNSAKRMDVGMMT